MKKFRIVWLGSKDNQIVEGHDIADACRRAGIGHGAIAAIDFHEEIKPDPQPSGDIQVHVTRAVIVQRNGLDNCSLYTDLVGNMWPEGSCVSFNFQLQGGTGAEWILDHFGIEAEVITVPGRNNKP